MAEAQEGINWRDVLRLGLEPFPFQNKDWKQPSFSNLKDAGGIAKAALNPNPIPEKNAPQKAVEVRPVPSPEPYISPLYRGPMPSAKDAEEYAKAYKEELLGTLPSIQPEIDKEASQQRVVDYLQKENPDAAFGARMVEASEGYRKGLEESQNILEPAAKALTESFKEVTGEEGKAGLLEQLQKKYPHLTREEVEKEYGFGRKLLVSVLGGIGGNPGIAQQQINQKLQDNQNNYNAELDLIMERPKVALSRFQAETARHAQKTDFLIRTMNALEEKAKGELAIADSPLKLEQQKQILTDIQKNKSIAEAQQKALKMQTDAAIQNALFQVQSNPLAVRLPFAGPTGQPDYIIGNDEKSKAILEADLPTWDVLLQPGGPVDVLKRDIRKESLKPGEKELSSKEKRHLFERIKELNPQEKTITGQPKKTEVKEFTDHDIMKYLTDMERYFSTWTTIHGHKPTLDTRILGVPQSQTQPSKGE